MSEGLPVTSDVPVRACGKCAECCTVMGVDELDKPMWTRCLHLAGVRGCSIYDERPEGCRKFDCLWRFGLGSNRSRPDKCGIVFVLTPDRYGIVGFVQSGGAKPWKKGEGKRLVEQYLSQGVPVFIATRSQRLSFMPERSGLSKSKLDAMQKAFESGEFS